jgi:hypothetical protein
MTFRARHAVFLGIAFVACTHTYSYQLGDGSTRTLTDTGTTEETTTERRKYLRCCLGERGCDALFEPDEPNRVGKACSSISAEHWGFTPEERFFLLHKACRLIQATDTMTDGTGHLGLACHALLRLYLTDPSGFDAHWNRDEVAQMACVTNGSCVSAVFLLAAREPISESEQNGNLIYEFGYIPSSRHIAGRLRRADPTLGPERDKLVHEFLTRACFELKDDPYGEWEARAACRALAEAPFNEAKAVAKLAEADRATKARAHVEPEPRTPDAELEDPETGRAEANERARLEDERRFAREREEDAERQRKYDADMAQLDAQLRAARENLGKRDTTFDGARRAMEDLIARNQAEAERVRQARAEQARAAAEARQEASSRRLAVELDTPGPGSRGADDDPTLLAFPFCASGELTNSAVTHWCCDETGPRAPEYSCRFSDARGQYRVHQYCAGRAVAIDRVQRGTTARLRTESCRVHQPEDNCPTPPCGRVVR